MHGDHNGRGPASPLRIGHNRAVPIRFRRGGPACPPIFGPPCPPGMGLFGVECGQTHRSAPTGGLLREASGKLTIGGVGHCIHPVDRGRKSRLNSAPPPSEPCVRISRTRLSGRWFTSERIDRPQCGLWLTRTTHTQQRRRLASVDDRHLVLSPFLLDACEEYCASAFSANHPRV